MRIFITLSAFPIPTFAKPQAIINRVNNSSESTEILSNYTTQDKIKTNSAQFA